MAKQIYNITINVLLWLAESKLLAFDDKQRAGLKRAAQILGDIVLLVD